MSFFLAILSSPQSLVRMGLVNQIRMSACPLRNCPLLTYSRMDAISFVLGIKSSHLRSTHLRDLVYRGRVLKTSVINEDGSATVNGANGDIALSHETPSTKVLQERNDPKSAWVMAVYEDDTGDEQLWKRTITNQGASEYRINNKVVTAQQYNEALEAENILIKARNFLVFQGDVEAIASQSPKDLTRLIEQISGSLEHKAEYERMKEAQDEAIENQNFNLNRRRGINSEIKQYQEQKREADNYARKAEQRDRAIVSHVLWKLYRFQNLMAESGAEIRKHQEELKEYRRRIAKYERDLEEARKEQAKVARDVGKLERSIKEKEGEVEDKENSLLPITEKILVTKEGLTRVTSRIDTISKERESKSEAVRRLANDLKVVERAESQWEIEWRKLSERGGRALSDADLQQYSKLKEDVSKRISVDQVKATNLTRQLRADEETVRSLKGKVDTIQSRILELEMDITGTANNKTAASDVIRQTSQQAETKKKSHNYLTSERLRKSLLRKELDEKLQEVLNKLSDAEDGRKQNDKELKMKTTIADLKRFFPGVRGRVHELCTPKIRKYDQAVSTFLGRHIDAIVVDDERIANECIQYLRSERRGVATFIPLDTISGTTIDSNLKGMHKGTRMAIDTIDYDKVYDRAMSYACGNTIVCDDMSIARYICYEKGLDIKAVTLDGTVISKGGLMTGGRGKEQNSMRWEDALVDNLRKSVDRYRTDLAALAETRRETTEEETLQSELAGLDQRLVYAKEEVRAYERNLSSKEKELSHSRKELAEANSKFHEKDSELKDLKASLGTFQDAISQVEDRVFDEFCRNLGYENIRVYEAQQGSLQQEGAQKKLEFAQQKNKLESRRSLEEQQLREIDDRVDGLRAKMNRDQYLIDQLETQKKVTSDEADMLMVTLEQRKEDLIKQQALYEKKAEKATEQRREVQKRSRTVDSTLREVSRLESEIQRNATDRYALLRRCKLEDIVIPLGPDSNSLDQLPIDGILQSEPDAISLDGDRDDSGLDASSGRDYGIMIDFDDLDDELKDVSFLC